MYEMVYNEEYDLTQVKIGKYGYLGLFRGYRVQFSASEEQEYSHGHSQTGLELMIDNAEHSNVLQSAIALASIYEAGYTAQDFWINQREEGYPLVQELLNSIAAHYRFEPATVQEVLDLVKVQDAPADVFYHSGITAVTHSSPLTNGKIKRMASTVAAVLYSGSNLVLTEFISGKMYSMDVGDLGVNEVNQLMFLLRLAGGVVPHPVRYSVNGVPASEPFEVNAFISQEYYVMDEARHIAQVLGFPSHLEA